MRNFIPAPKSHERFVKETYQEFKDSNVSIYIDNENRKKRSEILRALKSNRDKYRTVLHYIYSGRASKDHYKGCGIDSITEIILTKGKKSNYRIYCKVFKHNGKKIVMLLGTEKDFQKIQDNKRLADNLKNASKTYEYNFDEK